MTVGRSGSYGRSASGDACAGPACSGIQVVWPGAGPPAISSSKVAWIGLGSRPLLRADRASLCLRTFFFGSQYLARSYCLRRCTKRSRVSTRQRGSPDARFTWQPLLHTYPAGGRPRGRLGDSMLLSSAPTAPTASPPSMAPYISGWGDHCTSATAARLCRQVSSQNATICRTTQYGIFLS